MRPKSHSIVLALLIVLLPTTAWGGGLPWGQSMAQGRDLPRPLGLGIDLFYMNHAYDVDSLSLAISGLDLSSVSGFEVSNNLTEVNVKFDAWLWPFLNVFGLIGELDGNTFVDLRAANLPQVPFQTLRFDYSGLVYGGGVTLAGAGDRFFASLTATYTETDLSGDFESAVETVTLQPKVGIYGDGGSFWIGGMSIDAEERHQGSINLALLGSVGFDILLSERDVWHWTAGASVYWTDRWQITMEGGFGDKQTALLSTTYRF